MLIWTYLNISEQLENWRQPSTPHHAEMSASGASVTNSDDEEDESNMMVETRQNLFKRCLLPLPKVLSWDDLRCPKDSQAPNIKIFGQGVKFNQTMTIYGGLMYFSHNKSNQKALKIELEEVLEPTWATFYAIACICCVGNACVAYVLQWIRSSRFSSPVSVVGAYLGMSWYHTQVDLPHIRHFRRIQAHWQAYDAYARVCMAMGTNQSLGRWVINGIQWQHWCWMNMTGTVCPAHKFAEIGRMKW
jgi:hypothetical protein